MAFNRNPPTKCFTGAGDLYQGVKALVYRIKFTFGEVERRLFCKIHPLPQRHMEFYNYYKKFFTLSNDMLCVANTEAYFTHLNPFFCQLLGYTEEELISRKFLDFVHPDDVASTVAEVAKLSQGINTINFVNRYRCKDGSYKYLQWSSTPDTATGEIFAVARDVTEQHQREEEILLLNKSLEAALREMESFSYSVSHDLRAPVRAISGFARIITDKHSEPLSSEAKELLNIINSESTRMGKLIDDLLSFSKLGKKDLQRTMIPMKELAHEAVQEVQLLHPVSTDLHIHIDTLPDAYCDRSLIRQVFVNLVSNAIKFSEHKAEARITIGYTEHDAMVTYYVKDNGAGFDMKYYDKLFGLFQRLHSQEEFGGIGIGLANVQKIVHRLGGEVWAEGKVNEGATFYFSLPRQAPHIVHLP
ncbi:MAG: PAS domain S-box protein [Bacteroidetes bacterium]|nr:PAS domain S-box protein [Bacteroidota bacterium]